MFALKTDLGDFIQPSQECVKMILPVAQGTGQNPSTKAKVTIDQDMEDEWKIQSDPGHNIKPDLIKAKGESQTAKVSLTDCLACSGCVTSAETVLIQRHSAEEFLKLFAKDSMETQNFVVVAISPQSIASLTTFYKQPNELTTFKKLQTIFTKLGANFVIDLSLFNLLSLQLAYTEFKESFTKSHKYQMVQESLQVEGGLHKKSVHSSKQEEGVPILSSECPGWVCYAEKVVGEMAFPFMSKVKSPQQLCGCLLKHYLSLKNKISPEFVKLVTVMPCYDKKLEAVRPNFTLHEDVGQANPDLEIKEIDTVLATHELVDLFKEEDFNQTELFHWEKEDIDMKGSPSGWGFMEIMEQFVDMAVGVENFHQISILNTTSNGYLEYIFRRAARELFNVVIDPLQPLEYVQGKNKDLKECVLEIQGQVVMKFSAAYGFRNIQNIIRNIKRGKCDYDYVEIMACPGGCLNGGGQVKPKDLNMDPKQLLEMLEMQFKNMADKKLVPNPEDDKSIKQLIQMMSLAYSNWHETKFHAIPKEIVGTHNIVW